MPPARNLAQERAASLSEVDSNVLGGLYVSMFMVVDCMICLTWPI